MNNEKKLLKAIIMVGHSNAGKSSLCQSLLKSDKRIRFSISATTRPQRPDEIHSEHYHFLNENSFKKLIQSNAFIEWDLQGTGHYYGTLISEVGRLNNSGFTVLFDVNPKGADVLMEYFKDTSVTLFVTVPGESVEEKQAELLRRAQLSSHRDGIESRIARVYDELCWAEKKQIDHWIVNDDLDKSLILFQNIVAHAKRQLRREQVFNHSHIDAPGGTLRD